MAIVLSQPFELSARDKAIAEIALIIEDAMISDEEVTPYGLADEIVNCLLPSTRSGPPLER